LKLVRAASDDPGLFRHYSLCASAGANTPEILLFGNLHGGNHENLYFYYINFYPVGNRKTDIGARGGTID
jgi:hypothetical protein